jgi:hypothetical protein
MLKGVKCPKRNFPPTFLIRNLMRSPEGIQNDMLFVYLNPYMLSYEHTIFYSLIST